MDGKCRTDKDRRRKGEGIARVRRLFAKYVFSSFMSNCRLFREICLFIRVLYRYGSYKGKKEWRIKFDWKFSFFRGETFMSKYFKLDIS